MKDTCTRVTVDEIITLWRIDKSSAIKQINKQFFLSNGVNRFNTFTSGGVKRGGKGTI